MARGALQQEIHSSGSTILRCSWMRRTLDTPAALRVPSQQASGGERGCEKRGWPLGGGGGGAAGTDGVDGGREGKE